MQLNRQRRSLPIEHKPFARGARLTPESLTFIPGDVPIRPLRDQLIIEPIDATWSAIIEIVNLQRPVRGVVKAVGPGRYELGYLDKDGDHTRDRRKRRGIYETRTFIPTQVKVGDTVELGQASYGEGAAEPYAFEAFYWGDRLHIMGASERDVAAVNDA